MNSLDLIFLTYKVTKLPLLYPIVMTFTSVHKVLIQCLAHSKSTQIVSCNYFLINVSHHYFCSLQSQPQPLPFIRSFAQQMLPEG